MTLQLSLILGIFAALLMFSGDMLLYFTAGSYRPDGTLEPVISIMKRLPDRRLMLGGLIGPCASFFYCLGFYHITLMVPGQYRTGAFCITLLCSMGMIISGAYHSQCTYLGLIGKTDCRDGIEKVIRNLRLLSGISFLFLAAGLLFLSIGILSGMTCYPRYLFLFSPLVLYFLKYLWVKIPQPFLIVVYGGWYNLMFAVYFLAALLFSFRLQA